ncbi:MAG: PAS domain S-box protein [Pseudomonadales bacterium]|nr:PAS domain S-box protein [Pseudomonadales bacterium]
MDDGGASLGGLEALHRLSQLDDGDIDALCHEYLTIGLRLFDLSIGIVSRVEGQEYQVLAVQPEQEGLRKGACFSLSDTYCAAVIGKRGSVALHHVGGLEEMRSHPVYLNMKLESYLATPVRVRGEVFGTLNFSDTRPRQEPFSIEEITLLELMAQSLGRQLEKSLSDREREDSYSELQDNMALFEGAFRHAPIGMAIVAPNGRWLRVNDAVSQIVGYSADELLAMDFQSITHPDDLEKDLAFVESLLRGEADTYRMRKRYTHKDGQEVWVLLAVSLVRHDGGAPRYFLSQIEDITALVHGQLALREQRDELEQLNLELADLARKDPLTGLINRSVIIEQLRQHLALGSRTHQPLSLILLAVGNLNELNATHGHGCGDEALVAVAEALCRVSDGQAELARFSGSQFLALMPEVGLNTAESLAGDFRHGVLSLPDLPLPLSVSLGVATLMPCEESAGQEATLDSALAAVEAALLAARDAGSNLVRTVTL